jgi:hypothetical protein
MADLELGHVSMTPGATRLIRESCGDADQAAAFTMLLLARHATGDYGELDAHDVVANRSARRNGARIMSSYQTPIGKVWIITDAETDVCEACWTGAGVCEPDKGVRTNGMHFRTDLPPRRLTTTILLPEEY